MQTRKSFFKHPLLIVSLGCVMAFAVACGDDDDSSGPTPSGGSKNTAGTAGKNAAAGDNTGGTSPTAGKNSTAGTSTGNTNTGGAAGGGPEPMAGAAGMGGAPVNCTDDTDMGCYDTSVCAPKALTDFLNACPTTGCEPFDNTKLTSIKAGKLPDLP